MSKLQAVQDDLTYWDRYRGDPNIVWRLTPTGEEEFAVMCSCGEWWGWNTNLRMMKGILSVMWRDGCALC